MKGNPIRLCLMKITVKLRLKQDSRELQEKIKTLTELLHVFELKDLPFC